MDKHEFNIKVDQIKKMVSKGDFETAMKIADTIDWRRVRNANLLSMISSVYEKNAEYQEAKDILLIAFERAPIGKRLLYKLTQLALKEGDIEEAESYYREFCDLAGDDSRQDILRYLILKAKGAPIDQLIHSLESYTSIELDEKWLYELADLYHQAGKEDACVRTCDKIMLMFGLGQYVDKAMELKLQYAPLTKYQMDLVENRDKYEEKLRQVEQNGVSAVHSQEETISREEEEMAAATRRDQVAAMEARSAAQPAVPVYTDAVSAGSVSHYAGGLAQPAAAGYPENTAQPLSSVYPDSASFSQANFSQANGYGGEAVQVSAGSRNSGGVRPPSGEDYRRSGGQAREEEMVSNIAASFAAAAAQPQGAVVSPEERLEVSMKEAEAEANLAEEVSKISIDSYSEEPVREKTRVLQSVKDLKKAGEQPEKTKVLDEIRHIQTGKPAEEPAKEPVHVKESVHAKEPVNQSPVSGKHFMVEARTAEAGLEIAVQSLKRMYQLSGSKRPVAKISGEKLNQKGILASAPKLAGKDLIVENAGDLCDPMLEELDQFLAEDKSQMIVVLVDNPRQMEGIRRINASLAAKFQVITAVEEAEKVLLHRAEQRRSQTVSAAGARGASSAEAQQPAAPRESVMDRSAAVQRESAAAQVSVQRTVDSVRQPAPQREVNSVRQPAPQREVNSVRQPVPQREMDSVRQPVPQREMDSVRQSAPQREVNSVHQPVPQREVNSVRQPVSQRENTPVAQPGVQRDGDLARQNSAGARSSMTNSAPASRDTKVFSRVETAVSSEMETAASSRVETASSSNIVQMRSKSASLPGEDDLMEQGKDNMDEIDDGRIMDIDEFAQYCCHYASQIDCNISGKSMLALYERIEIMEEDGVELTKTAAEDLIEEAADRAEKPSIGKRIAGLFSSKYDKEGLLILKEEHFI